MQTDTKKLPRLRRFIADPERYRERYGNFTLTDRDLDILELVWRYRMLDSRHIRALIPGSDQVITRRLQGLMHNRYVMACWPRERMRVELNQGSPYKIYSLEREGWRALTTAGRVDVEDESAKEWRKAHGRITTWFAEHQVMISNFRCILEQACRATPGLELARWDQTEAIRAQVTLRDGAIHRLAPDAFFTLSVNGTPRHCFLEADRSTEESRRILQKYVAYWWFLQSGSYSEVVENYKHTAVLLLTSGTDRRLGNMMTTLRQMERPNRPRWGGPGWFWFGREADLSLEEPASVLSPMWQTVTGPGARQLV